MNIFLQKELIDYEKYVFGLIRDLKPQIIFVMILFSTGIVIGFTDILNFNEFINQMINELLNRFKDYRGMELFAQILTQNLKATAVVIYTGIFFSIFPAFAAIMNGMIIGTVIQRFSLVSSKTVFEGILYLLPHGVFEIPSILLALALGIKFGSWPFKKNKLAYIRAKFLQSSKGYILVIFPFLVIAALIETIGIETIYLLNSK